MGRDEMLDLLGIGDEDDSKDVKTEELAIEGLDTKPAVPASPTALQLDAWSLRQGKEMLDEAKADTEGGLYPRLVPPAADSSPSLASQEKAANTLADFFGAAFESEPKLNPACEDLMRHEFVKQLLETPDYHALHEQTVYNRNASEIAASAFTRQYVELVEETAKKKEKADKDAREGKTPKGGKGKDKDDLGIPMLKAVGEALKEAQAEVDEAEDTANALGGLGGEDGKIDPKKAGALFKRVQKSEKLRRICELAGRFRRLAQSKQRQKTEHGLDDVVGVVLDGDIGRLLPSELAKLNDDDLELDTLRRLVERETQCREYKGVEPVALGPIVVTVDESGSMAGEKIYTAKALALALAWIARRQKRWVALVGFAGGTTGTRLALPPGKWDETKVCDWLEHFYSGGTRMDVPLSEVPNVYWPEFVAQGMARGKTDLICITDAIVEIPEEMKNNFLAWKAVEKVKMYSLVVEGEPGDLAQVSDELYQVPSLSVSEEAVGKVLSI